MSKIDHALQLLNGIRSEELPCNKVQGENSRGPKTPMEKGETEEASYSVVFRNYGDRVKVIARKRNSWGQTAA